MLGSLGLHGSLLSEEKKLTLFYPNALGTASSTHGRPTHAFCLDGVITHIRFKVSARVRGKEMQVIFNKGGGGGEVITTWRFGLVGRFIVSKGTAPPHAQISFHGEDDTILSYGRL